MHKIVFFVPEAHAETVKQALFARGAGRFDNYDCCSWQTSGTGQFRPLENSKPFIGRENVVETVQELRIEMICRDDILREVLRALIEAHPYEEPAYEAYKILSLDEI